MLPHTIFHAGVIIYELSASVNCFPEKILPGGTTAAGSPLSPSRPIRKAATLPSRRPAAKSFFCVRHKACTQGPAVPVGKTMLGGVEPRGTRASKAPQGSAVGRGVSH